MADDNKKIATRIVAIFTTGDLSAVDSVIAADYIDHQGLHGIRISGPDGFRRVVAAARAAYPEGLNVLVQDTVAEADKVVLRLRWRGTAPRSTAEQPELVERETVDILRFVSGKAVEHWGARLGSAEGTASS